MPEKATHEMCSPELDWGSIILTMIYIVDFGSQTTHLISRRLKDLGADSQIIHPEDALAKITEDKPAGLILSGGPASVYEKGAPTVDKKIFELGIPALGICYGFMTIARELGGVVDAGRKKFSPSQF